MKSRRPRFGSSIQKTFSYKLLSITATVLLAVAAVVVSVHSSSSPASIAGRTAAKSSENPRYPWGDLKNRQMAAGSSLSGFAPLALLAPPAPTVTATKTDALFTDVDGDLQADPGDTLKYTVTIDSSGADATGVMFTDTVDPNTAFVPGSLTATPVAVDDSYTATGNIRISVAAPGVLGNDFAGVPSATVTAPPITSTNGGNVTLNADGSFTYNPPAGFEGSDTFSYTLTNSAGSNSATVTINVSGMIWFIDNNASCPCDGRLTNPFNTLASFAAVNNGTGNNPAANDNIFLYESAIDYAGPVTLLSGQRFIGQDATASLSAITGLTPPSGSDPLPATNSGNGTIVNITTGNAITVGSSNTLTGFTGGDSTTDISGTGFGTLTISDVTLNGTGQALNLTTGTLAATFGNISSTNSGTTGISLTSVAGSLTTPTTSITNPGGIGISVGTSSATLNFGNTTSTGSGGTGVSLLTNTGAITFGSLNISPDANQRGLLATDNSNTVTSTGGAITTSLATAVEITRASGTTPLAIALTSISATGGNNGIFLSNSSGSFTVNGDGTNVTKGGNDTGGTISGMIGLDGTTNGIGVYLNNTTNITLRRVHLSNLSNMGVHGLSVTGFTLQYSKIDGVNGTTSGSNDLNLEGPLVLGRTNPSLANGLFGRGLIDNCIISGGIQHNTEFFNQSGSPNLTISNSDIKSNSTTLGSDGIQVEMTGTAIATISVEDSTLDDNRSQALQVTALGSSFADITVDTCAIKRTTQGNEGVVLQNGADADLTVHVTNNTFTGVLGANILVGQVAGNATANSNLIGVIQNNMITVGNATTFPVNRTLIVFFSSTIGQVSTANVLVDANTINTFSDPAGGLPEPLFISTPDANTDPSFTATITNNVVNITDPGGTSLRGIAIQSTQNISAGCIDVRGNDVNYTPAAPANGIRVRQVNPATLQLEQGASAGTAATVLAANNPLSTTEVLGTVTVVGNSTCQPAPTLVSQSMTKSSVQNNSMLGSGPTTDQQDILFASLGQEPAEGNVGKLSPADLSWMVQTAIERWRAAGISIEDLMRLQTVTFEITDLPNGQLATATSTRVKIDETAAGYGWYSDVSPMEDSEFDVPVLDRELQTTASSQAFGRMDLLTVVMRELGVAYRQGKNLLPKQLRPLMQNTLPPAVRRLPDSRNIQLTGSPTGVSGKNRTGREKSLASQISRRSARRPNTSSTSPGSIKKVAFNADAKQTSGRNSRLMNHAPMNRTTATLLSSMLADVMLNIGTLPAGENVIIAFNVTVDDPFGGALPQVSNQGTVSGSNFADVLTDDPDVGGTADPTVTPIDLPQVTLAVSPASVLEDGATNLVYTFTRTGSTANAMTVNFSVGGTASFTEPDYTQTGAASFTATSGTVVFASGNSTASVTINPSADTTVEPDETVDLTVTSGIGYTVGSPSAASGTITNDDTDVSVAVSPASVAEDGATNLVYTFTRAGVTTNSLTVNFSVGGTADFGVSPNDYTQTGATSFTPPTGTVTFTAGNSTATVTVNPEADSFVETDETVVLTVTSGAGYNVSSPSSATGTIINDDADVSVAVSPASVAEDGATNLVYTFTRTGFIGGALTVNFSVGGTAVFGPSPDDYTQTGATTFTTTTGSVTFAASSSTATVTVDPETDTTPESDETVVISLTAGAGYNVVNPSSATGTILNDDTIVTVAVAPSSTAEGGANLVYTFTRTGSTASAVTVNFSVGGSAAFPADYSQTGAATFTPPTATVTFGAGSSTATVNVTPLSDCMVEGSETVEFTVQPGSGYGVGSPSMATGTITNTPDSTPPVITMIPNVNITYWPPDHGYQTVAVTDFVASASDDCDPTVNITSVYILKITSDEPENGAGDGNTLNDIVIAAGCKTAQLRAERSVSGNGRVYTITFKVKDSAGNFTTATAQVTVRASLNSPAVDDGPMYTVNSICP